MGPIVKVRRQQLKMLGHVQSDYQQYTGKTPEQVSRFLDGVYSATKDEIAEFEEYRYKVQIQQEIMDMSNRCSSQYTYRFSDSMNPTLQLKPHHITGWGKSLTNNTLVPFYVNKVECTSKSGIRVTFVNCNNPQKAFVHIFDTTVTCHNTPVTTELELQSINQRRNRHLLNQLNLWNWNEFSSKKIHKTFSSYIGTTQALWLSFAMVHGRLFLIDLKRLGIYANPYAKCNKHFKITYINRGPANV